MSPAPPDRSPEVRSLADLLGRIEEDRVLAGGLMLGRLGARWGEVVGGRLAAETAPLRLDHGVLTVAASTQPWAAQVRFLGAEIARNATAAGASVRDVRVIVDPRAIRHRGDGVR